MPSHAPARACPAPPDRSADHPPTAPGHALLSHLDPPVPPLGVAPFLAMNAWFLLLPAVLLGCDPPAAPVAPEPAVTPPVAWSLWVDRQGRSLHVLDGEGREAWRSPVGIGAGGLGQKRSMEDRITPTGDFLVDLVLYDDPTWDAVAEATRARLAERDPDFAALLADPAGLARLRATMDQLDFDGDGQPDHAYGAAYLGLDGGGGPTGPKLRRRGPDLYWYSIALHGTPDPTRIGQATSGGCVHLPEAVLRRLVTERIATVGTRVHVEDGPPPVEGGAGRSWFGGRSPTVEVVGALDRRVAPE